MRCTPAEALTLVALPFTSCLDARIRRSAFDSQSSLFQFVASQVPPHPGDALPAPG